MTNLYILHVYPLTFDEFLRASDESLFKYYSMISVNDDIIEIMHQKLLDAFNQYLIIGGMPQVVNSWLNTRDPIRISNLQNTILEIYENDFSKHNGSVNSGRILLAFRSLVPQLSKENEKFIYGVIRQGARAREFEEAVEWIVSAGLVNRVYNVSQAQMPLKAYDILNCFTQLSQLGIWVKTFNKCGLALRLLFKNTIMFFLFRSAYVPKEFLDKVGSLLVPVI